MDIQTLIEKNATVLQAHDGHAAAAEKAEREYIEQQKAEAIREAKQMWIKMGADEAEISDDGVVCVGDWAVSAIARARFNQLHVTVVITPADKESATWKLLAAAEDEDHTSRVKTSWLEHDSDHLLGKVVAYIRDTLPMMPGIIQEMLSEIENTAAVNGGAE